MKNKKHIEHDEPTIATGIDDDEELSQKATEEDVKKGESTTVVRLSWDEDER
ncbi:hypothetical protein [Desertibacillus haloalkaliphilus]|uniref:hypothetical protein n=1 Tax=Desertibacillus haloalkaliphilus TaxID=1328930 RepID=UPI001C27FFEA|nr:hypothetical protein [Desertibacillus haloalkaliphilus]MBU8905700.1 hypothetical protein [Desertibacillus haloalkaliphilus]